MWHGAGQPCLSPEVRVAYLAEVLGARSGLLLGLLSGLAGPGWLLVRQATAQALEEGEGTEHCHRTPPGPGTPDPAGREDLADLSRGPRCQRLLAVGHAPIGLSGTLWMAKAHGLWVGWVCCLSTHGVLAARAGPSSLAPSAAGPPLPSRPAKPSSNPAASTCLPSLCLISSFLCPSFLFFILIIFSSYVLLIQYFLCSFFFFFLEIPQIVRIFFPGPIIATYYFKIIMYL